MLSLLREDRHFVCCSPFTFAFYFRRKHTWREDAIWTRLISCNLMSQVAKTRYCYSRGLIPYYIPLWTTSGRQLDLRHQTNPTGMLFFHYCRPRPKADVVELRAQSQIGFSPPFHYGRSGRIIHNLQPRESARLDHAVSRRSLSSLTNSLSHHSPLPHPTCFVA